MPSWNVFSLAQLSPAGFTMRKRTKAGCSLVNIPGGTKAEGGVYWEVLGMGVWRLA